ncbi:ATP-binding cassette domain-containing protein [Ideonella sp.]|uniref:ATP-binding cassette domain-containing protein n=1 Tax=Ideonella sp. TaxID=1929293 RepID=UPI0035AF92E3
MKTSLATEAGYGAARPSPAPALAVVQTEAAAGPALALRHLSVPLPRGLLTIEGWQIERGHKVAMIGRNGVGKTSVVEALLGLREGARVEGTMLGTELAQWHRRPELRKRLGVQLQRVAFPGRPRVRELVAMHRALFDHTSGEVMEALGVPALLPRLYEFLSRGETQRIDLFLALAHEPEILFLDEPFTGLDPQFAKNLSALIRRQTRATIVMSCHTIEEFSLVDKVAWLKTDGLARYDAPEHLRHELVGDYRLVAQCEDEAGAARLAQSLASDVPSGARIHTDGARVQVAAAEPLADLARALVDRAGVQSVEAGRSTLVDLLRHCAKEGA